MEITVRLKTQSSSPTLGMKISWVAWASQKCHGENKRRSCIRYIRCVKIYKNKGRMEEKKKNELYCLQKEALSFLCLKYCSSKLTMKYLIGKKRKLLEWRLQVLYLNITENL